MQAWLRGHRLKEARRAVQVRTIEGVGEDQEIRMRPRLLALSDSAMTDMPETFEAFLRIWIAENIGTLGIQINATNLKYILRVKADELEKAATIKGFYGELVEAVHCQTIGSLRPRVPAVLGRQSRSRQPR
jgi:hypothetical protein